MNIYLHILLQTNHHFIVGIIIVFSIKYRLDTNLYCVHYWCISLILLLELVPKEKSKEGKSALYFLEKETVQYRKCIGKRERDHGTRTLSTN